MFVALSICEEKLYLFFLIFAKWWILDWDEWFWMVNKNRFLLTFFYCLMRYIVLRIVASFFFLSFAKWRILDRERERDWSTVKKNSDVFLKCSLPYRFARKNCICLYKMADLRLRLIDGFGWLIRIDFCHFYTCLILFSTSGARMILIVNKIWIKINFEFWRLSIIKCRNCSF